MADITKNQSLRIWGENANVEKRDLDTSVAQTVLKGIALILDANVDAVNAVVFTSGVTLATSDTFLGIALGKVDVLTTDVEGDKVSQHYGNGSIVGFLMSQFGTFNNGSLGKDMHLSDSGTLTTTLSTNLKIGVLHAVEDGYAYVRIEAPFDVA